VLRHRVTVLTLCPLGEPEIAIGHEPRIEPWLPRKSNRLPSFKSRRTLSLLENEPRERNSSPEKNLSNNREPSANSGLDTETKNFSTTGRRRSFFVDIPFYRTTYLKMGRLVGINVRETSNLKVRKWYNSGSQPSFFTRRKVRSKGFLNVGSTLEARVRWRTRVNCRGVRTQVLITELFSTSLTKSASSRVFGVFFYFFRTHLCSRAVPLFSRTGDAPQFSSSLPCPTYELGPCHFIVSVCPPNISPITCDHDEVFKLPGPCREAGSLFT
jgi:hypothetical protein